MNNIYSISLVLIAFLFACHGTNPSTSSSDTTAEGLREQKTLKITKPKQGFYCGYLDSKGHMWFGSRGGGVFRYDGTTFTHLSTKDGLCDDNISCITEDKEGNLWFGTPKGACRYDGKKFSNLNIPQSDTSSVWLDKVYPIVNPNQVMSMLEDPQGNLWIGTNGAGVYRYDGTSFTQFLSDVGMFYEDGQQHNIVLSMTEDQKGNIWFSSLSHGGVSRYDGQSFTHYTEELSDDFIRFVYSDRKGNIWIGTHGNHNGGLDLFDGEKFTAFHKTDDGLSHNNVWWIHEDPSGKLWMGSGTSYLSIFDGEKFRVFTANDGRRFDQILFVVEDAQQKIWFGGQYGLWRFDGEVVTSMM